MKKMTKNKFNQAQNHSFFGVLLNGVLSLALMANAASVPGVLTQSEVVGELPVFETDLDITSLVALTPLNEGRARFTVEMTAYSSTPDQTDDTPFITASGAHVRDGIVAANFLPLHTKIKIPELFGDKVFEVEDRMNRRYQNRVDIWMETRQEALNFGIKRNVEIVVL